MKKKLALGFVSLSIAGLLSAGIILPTVNGGAASTSFTTWTAYSTNKVIQQATRNESFINTGDTVKIKLNEKFVHLFDKESELSIMSREYGNN